MKHARMLLTLPLAAAGLAGAVPAPAAPAAMKECNRRAEVTAGAVHDLRKTHYGPDGHGVLDPGTPDRLAGRGTYVAQAGTKVRFGSVTYALGQDTVFALSCFGHTRAEGAIFPALNVFSGTATATAKAGKPGGLISNEGLFDPYLERPMSFRLERVAKGDPTLQEILDRGTSVVTFGKVVVGRTKGDGKLNITPYVGRRRGVCVQHDGGTLVSRKLDKDGYFVGSVEYDDERRRN